MEFLVICFCVGWVASHAFGEKRTEYEHSQDEHREKYLKRLQDRHPSWSRTRQERYLQNAARRNALGHFAYLIRHGWSSTFNDFVDGWDKAKKAHRDWQHTHPDSLPPWQMLKAGWKNRRAKKKKKAKERDATGPDPALTKPVESDPQPADRRRPAPDDDRPDAEIRPFPNRTRREDPTPTPGNTAGSTNRRPNMEAPNLDSAAHAVTQIGERVTAYAAGLEQIVANALAGGLGADSEAMQHLVSLGETLRNARTYADAFTASLAKHSGGKEYADSGHAANTDYLKSS